jgi:hypothetical protein
MSDSMPDPADILNADVALADEFIHTANARLEAGVHPLAISAAMVHAAANFTAFAYAYGSAGPLDEKRVIEEFHQLMLGYDEHHRAHKAHREQEEPKSRLERFVDEVKKEQPE